MRIRRQFDTVSRVLRVAAALIVVLAVLLFAARPRAAAPPRNAADEIALRIIVVGSADEAARVTERLGRGESFAALAKALSIDPTAESGGLMKAVRLSDLRAELRGVLEHLRVGEVSPVIKVPAGFAVMMVEAGTPSGGAGSPAAPNAGISAAGSVKYVLDVDGLGESLLAIRALKKPDGWDQDPRTICQTRTESLTAIESALAEVVALQSGEELVDTPEKLGQAHFSLGQVYAYQGRMDQAIDQFETGYRLLQSQSSTSLQLMEEALGILYLHAAEMDNDLYHRPGDRCLLSVQGIPAFAKTARIEKAIDYFARYLTRKPDELEVKWLLNLAYMALGKYPGGVPREHRISLDAFAAREDVGRFVDIAPALGVDVFQPAGGVIVDDFDNDGRFDLITSTMISCGALHFFRSTPNHAFTDHTAAAGLSDAFGGLNILQTDYNNDGCLDVLQLRGGWEVRLRKSLLRNNCDGTFTDVTVAAGLAEPATKTQAAVSVDVNNDGRLDIFVGNEDSPAQLFMNKGDGTFEDVAHAAGVDRTALSKGVAAADYDNDGWPDLYVSNFASSSSGANFLYHNNRDGTFSDVTGTAGVPGAGLGFATWFFDYDNDGWSDLFVTSYYPSVDETLRSYLNLPHNGNSMKLYKNGGNGTFREVSHEAGLDNVFMPMGSNFGDIDNDGFLDMYLGTGNPSYASLVPSVLLRNRAGRDFVDVTAASGTGELHKGHGVAFADLDGDGSDEIVFEVGGATPGDAHRLRVFKNPGHGNDWLNLKLVGERTNRAAVGARIAVLVEDAGQASRTIYRTVGSGGSFGSSPLQQHIGLGRAARIKEVEVWWPASNTHQRFPNVDKNQTLEIREFATTYTTLSPSHPQERPSNGEASCAR